MKLPLQSIVKHDLRKNKASLRLLSTKNQVPVPNAKMHFIDANDFLFAAATKFNCMTLDEYIEVNCLSKAVAKK